MSAIKLFGTVVSNEHSKGSFNDAQGNMIKYDFWTNYVVNGDGAPTLLRTQDAIKPGTKLDQMDVLPRIKGQNVVFVPKQ
jgi:hypothetical protein